MVGSSSWHAKSSVTRNLQDHTEKKLNSVCNSGLLSSKTISVDEDPISYDSVKLVQKVESQESWIWGWLVGVKRVGLHKNQPGGEKWIKMIRPFEIQNGCLNTRQSSDLLMSERCRIRSSFESSPVYCSVRRDTAQKGFRWTSSTTHLLLPWPVQMVETQCHPSVPLWNKNLTFRRPFWMGDTRANSCC